MAGDNRACEGEDRRARVHHPCPLAKLGLGSWVWAKDVSNRCWGQTDDCAGEDTEDDHETDGRGDGVGERPKDEDEERRHQSDEAVHIHGAKVVAEVG